jgi:hypothetical protein
MKKFKKGISLMLALTLLVSLVVPSFAENTVQKYLQGEGVVKEEFENNQLLVHINDMDVALNVSEETIILDAKTGLPGTLKDLKAGDLVYAYYSPAMTRSLPPQSFATVIVTEVEKDKTRPAYFTVKEIISESDEEIRVLNDAGDLIARISKDAPISPFKTKQVVSIKDIKVGSELFIWYDIVAMSYPGQTNVQKTVFIKTTSESIININDQDIDLGELKIHEQNNQKMIPLRLVAETLGFEVTWDSSIRGAKLDDGSVKTTVVIGEDSYYKASSKAIGLTQSIELGAKPELIDNTMYVPAELFNLLYS